MTHVLRVFLAYWRAHPLQLTLAIFGVTLGVAVVTAMDLANASALASFRESIKTVTGNSFINHFKTDQLALQAFFFLFKESVAPDKFALF